MRAMRIREEKDTEEVIAEQVDAGAALSLLAEGLGLELEPNGCLVLHPDIFWADGAEEEGPRRCELDDTYGPPDEEGVARDYAEATYMEDDDAPPEIVVYHRAISPTGAIVRVELSRHTLTCECGCGCTERGICLDSNSGKYMCRTCDEWACDLGGQPLCRKESECEECGEDRIDEDRNGQWVYAPCDCDRAEARKMKCPSCGKRVGGEPGEEPQLCAGCQN